MCQHMTVLARAHANRWIAQCEHGTLHLHWDFVTAHLCLDDFMTLARFLGAHGRDPAASATWCQLTRTERDVTQLWLGLLGLSFAADDFALFLDTIAQAANACADVQREQGVPPPHAAQHYPMLTIDASAAVLN